MSCAHGRKYDSAILGLNRSGVVLIELFKGRELLVGHLDRLTHHKPRHPFRAGWCCQRPHEVEVVAAARQEIRGVDHIFAIAALRHGSENGINCVITAAAAIAVTHFDKNTDDCKLALFALVNKMHLHGVTLAINGIFTGGMEMKLEQFVINTANIYGTTGAIVELYCVAVVHHVDRRGGVVECDIIQLHCRRL